jgi:hypothetical protein
MEGTLWWTNHRSIENMREQDNLLGLSVLHYIGGVTEYNKITNWIVIHNRLAYTCGILSPHLNNRRVYLL